MQVPPTPNDFIPIMGMFTGIVSMILLTIGVIKVAQSSIGQAIARKIQGKSGLVEQELREELHELREQVADLEHRLADSEERLDFTERMLASGKQELPAP